MKRLLFLMPLFFIVLVFTGCDDASTMMKPVITEEPANTVPTTMVGEVKKPGEQPEPTEPEPAEEPAEKPEEPPADTTPPTVVEVAWYHDWRLTEPVVEDVGPGDTVYTVVVFSEPMQHIVADDDTARPALSIVTDDSATRFRMLPHSVSFESGEAKPLRGGTDDYLCKYTVPEDTVGTIALHIGSATADLAGNPVTDASEHLVPFTVQEPEPPVEKSEPAPISTEVTLVEVGSEYTFTVEGEVYPGYNPSPKLQHILDTHPSAQLPQFEEAVKMVEVIDWAYRKIWDAYYPDNSEKMGDMYIAVEGQFGLTKKVKDNLTSMYERFLGYYPDSYYWFAVECLRLLLQYTERLRFGEHYPTEEYEELKRQFSISLKEGYIVGQTNPNN